MDKILNDSGYLEKQSIGLKPTPVQWHQHVYLVVHLVRNIHYFRFIDSNMDCLEPG